MGPKSLLRPYREPTLGAGGAAGLLFAIALVCAAWLGLGAVPALAHGSGSQHHGYYVTFVARWCPEYTDIYANRQRNDIVESLEDLGPDTQYDDSGILINPVYESFPAQADCQPIPQWEFALGTDYESRAVTGVWGSLSKVTGAYRTRIVTRVATPLLNEDANPVPGRFLAGAVTIRLTRDQVEQASEPDRLWAQGGVPDDPVLANKFFITAPGDPEYAFGTLRCATDNLNGDNVEYIYFPEGVNHVFCYGYYVKPPPTSGTITIRKQVVGAPAGTDPAFQFPGGCSGCLSFDPTGFTLTSGQSTDFYRAGGTPGTQLPTWTVTEERVQSYNATVSCTALTAGGGPGQSTVDISGATSTIHLVAEEHVTCTYTNTYVPPTGGLVIDKITKGGVGTFVYDVAPVSGGGGTQRATATTTEPGVPATAVPALTGLAPGDYRILERVPKPPGGTWHLQGVVCNGQTRSTTAPFTVTIPSGAPVLCTFTNKLIQHGSIALAKITEGATGTASFLVSPVSGPPAQYLQTATTKTAGIAADAVPDTPADETDHLALGTYRITEQSPLDDLTGTWDLTQIECNGELVPFAQGATDVTLNTSHPAIRCVYTDTLSSTPSVEPGPQPPEPLPPEPTHPPGLSPDQPSAPWSDLAVTKTGSPPVVALGSVVTYRITVTNHGPDDAVDVVVGDKLPVAAVLVSVHADVGTCQAAAVIICRLGLIKPGAKAHVTVRVRPAGLSPAFKNRVVVGTDTYDPTLANNASHATVDVTGGPPAVGFG